MRKELRHEANERQKGKQEPKMQLLSSDKQQTSGAPPPHELPLAQQVVSVVSQSSRRESEVSVKSRLVRWLKWRARASLQALEASQARLAEIARALTAAQANKPRKLGACNSLRCRSGCVTLERAAAIERARELRSARRFDQHVCWRVSRTGSFLLKCVRLLAHLQLFSRFLCGRSRRRRS